MARNYSEAAAIEFLSNPKLPVISGHNQYFLWGPRGYHDWNIGSAAASRAQSWSCGRSRSFTIEESLRPSYVRRGIATSRHSIRHEINDKSTCHLIVVFSTDFSGVDVLRFGFVLPCLKRTLVLGEGASCD